MNPALADALKPFNLQPGETHSVTVNGHRVEVRCLTPDEESDSCHEVMLQPWVSFPRTPAGTLLATPGPIPLPSPPDIPPEEGEDSE